MIVSRRESVRKSIDRQRQERILRSTADIRDGVAALVAACPTMRRIHKVCGDPPLRRERAGFEGLAGIVVAQQVSAASAAAIWRRTRAILGPVTPGAIAAASDETLRAAGLSSGKIATLRRIADAASEGRLDLAKLARAENEKIHDTLTAIKGIGPWTADIYIMFALGRSDAWAPGDLALRTALTRADDRGEPVSLQEMSREGERWRPWRGVAARLLWAFHARSTVTPLPANHSTKKRAL
ncbi:MAG: DNA-3-methyladenine glycosylase 2 family protein [Hyphomicrobium sp.]|nr:DNA-3-methyladenine glycosylase 2 family protein [Hyphomicrobium sp.]